jgi:membrane protease YdiL (CAAX protease family)
MQLRASLSDRTPYRKFLIVVGLTLIGAVFFTAIGTMLSQLIFGINLTGEASILDQAGNASLVNAFRLFQGLAAIGTFILPAFGAAYLFSNQSSEFLGLEKKSNRIHLFMIFLLLVVAIPFINWMMQINGEMSLPSSLKGLQDWMEATEAQASKITKLLLGSTGVSDLLINLIIIAIIPAIGEELLFRGVIQKLFTELANSKGFAVILTSVLFSALHMQFFGFFPRFALGVMLGFLYVWSGSLWVPITAHFINNAMAVILTWFMERGTINFNPDTIGTEVGQEGMLAASVFLTWAILWWLKKQWVAKHRD